MIKKTEETVIKLETVCDDCQKTLDTNESYYHQCCICKKDLCYECVCFGRTILFPDEYEELDNSMKLCRHCKELVEEIDSKVYEALKTRDKEIEDLKRANQK